MKISTTLLQRNDFELKSTMLLSPRVSHLVAISDSFVRTIHLHSDVIRLLLAEDCHFGSKRRQVKPGDLLIELFGEEVDIVLVGLRLFPVLQDPAEPRPDW